MKRLLAIIAFLYACSDEAVDLYTWGDASAEIGVGFCNALVACGLHDAATADICASHVTWHLCEADRTCDVALESTAPDVVQTCMDAFADVGSDFQSNGCFLLFYGIAPPECTEALGLHPEPPMDAG